MQRLQTRAQFQAVLAGAIVAKTPHFALHRNGLDVVPAPDAGQAAPADPAATAAPSTARQAPALFPVHDMWMGALVPKRWAKRAVTRNAIKRQIYTVSAGFLHQYPKAAFVVRLRRDFSRKEFVSASSENLKRAVRTEVLALMQAGARAP
ncbi:ribonuclease P protein component [Polaromonas sp.]|uniref:ribonuclease P protein component n=1 Tax=Polaromonas sp. TaxID=1869339 RepID=UPI002FC9CB9B